MGKELELAIKISGKLDKSLNSAVRNAQTQLNALGKHGGRALTALTAATVAAGVKVAKDSVEAYQTYESALNSAAAVAGFEKGTKEYEMMNNAAREAGRTTVKTAEDSAHALEYMALAGWSVEDSTKALMPVLKLSAATNTDLATTSDLVTDSMANLGLGINDLQRYLDVSAAANNKSNQTAMQLQEAYLGVGGVLKNLNSPIEESAAVLGVLANRGTKGSEAGTALNAILVNMQKRSGDAYKAMTKLGVSMYDTNGRARSILDVFQDISDKTAGMTEEQRNLTYQMIGGKAHVDSMAKIMAGFTDTAADGKKEIYSLKEAFDNAGGSLDKLYGIKTDTFEGTMATLKSAYESMLIDIGERIAPSLKTAAESLIENMPNIENAIVGVFDRVIPIIANGLNFAANNADKIIKVVTNIVKAFLMFKAIKGVVNIAKLAKDISTLVKAAGGLATLKGAASSLAGIGTGAAGAAASFMPLAGFILATGAAAYYLYGNLDKVSYKWADSMHDAATETQKASEKLTTMSKLQNEIAGLKTIIHSDSATTEQIDNAKQRLSEIAEMLEREYGLHINIDSENLDETAEKVSRIVSGLNAAARADFNASVNTAIETIENTYSDYQSDVSNLPTKQAELDALNSKAAEYAETWGKISAAVKNHKTGTKNGATYSDEQYLRDMASYQREIIDFYNKNGLQKSSYLEMDFTGDAATATRWSEELENSGNQYMTQAKSMGDTVTELTGKIQQYESDISDVTNNIAETLANDVLLGDRAGIQATEGTFNSFIQRLKSLGLETDTAVEKMALAKQGFVEVAEATAAGDDAINAVIADMVKIGEANELFGDLNAAGIADKLSDMAHAMGLIPENKTISINAEGNYEVITAAEEQIASLNSIGNVNLSVNANGDFSILNEATNEMQILEGFGAVSLQVNAAGNIEVLDEAQQVIATVDSKTAKVSVNSSVAGMDKVQNAIDNQNELTDVSVQQIATGSFPGMENISSALQYQSQLNDKTVTYKVIYKQERTPPANNATGTDYWRGGLTYLNDQPGVADPRELITYNDRAWWYSGRDVLADIPRGARIFTAAESRAFINGSHRNGLDRVPFDGYIAELHKGESVLTADAAADYRGESFAELLDYVREMLDAPRWDRSSGDGGGTNITFAPQITVTGNGDKETIMTAVRMTYPEFREYMQEYERETRRKVF